MREHSLAGRRSRLLTLHLGVVPFFAQLWVRAVVERADELGDAVRQVVPLAVDLGSTAVGRPFTRYSVASSTS